MDFASPPDYENPADSGSDNLYEVTMEAQDDASQPGFSGNHDYSYQYHRLARNNLAHVQYMVRVTATRNDDPERMENRPIGKQRSVGRRTGTSRDSTLTTSEQVNQSRKAESVTAISSPGLRLRSGRIGLQRRLGFLGSFLRSGLTGITPSYEPIGRAATTVRRRLS